MDALPPIFDLQGPGELALDVHLGSVPHAFPKLTNRSAWNTFQKLGESPMYSKEVTGQA